MAPELKAQLDAITLQLAAMTAAAGGGGAPPAGGAGTGWLTPPAPQGAMPAPAGWSVVMELDVQGPRGQGKATVDLCYGPETWAQAPQIVAALIQQGYPVKVWVPKAAGGFPPRGGGYPPRPAWGG